LASLDAKHLSFDEAATTSSAEEEEEKDMEE
jgi:hypothetical protein